MFNATNKNNGFTLVEMLVTMFIFSLIIGAISGVFVSAIRAQRYNLAYQQLLDQTSYALEYMARAIRMAKKDDGTCGFSGKNYKLVGDNSIKFKTYHDQCWEFFLQGGQLKMNKNGSPYELTSNKFVVAPLKFAVSGDGADQEQPKVTLFMEIQGKDPAPQPKIKIQTTISQRNLDM